MTNIDTAEKVDVCHRRRKHSVENTYLLTIKVKRFIDLRFLFLIHNKDELIGYRQFKHHKNFKFNCANC